MKNFWEEIKPYIVYIIVGLIFAFLIIYPFKGCHAEVIITKYAKIITTTQLHPTSDRIMGRVDGCIEEIAKKLEIDIPKDKILVTINVFPNKIYVQTISRNEDAIACTLLPVEGKLNFTPLMYFSQDTYENNILTHELIHLLIYYQNVSLSEDSYTHEALANGLEDVLCK